MAQNAEKEWRNKFIEAGKSQMAAEEKLNASQPAIATLESRTQELVLNFGVHSLKSFRKENSELQNKNLGVQKKSYALWKLTQVQTTSLIACSIDIL